MSEADFTNAIRGIHRWSYEAAERAFEELDPFIVALAPDAPADLAEAWAALHKCLSPEYVARRKSRLEAEGRTDLDFDGRRRSSIDDVSTGRYRDNDPDWPRKKP